MMNTPTTIEKVRLRVSASQPSERKNEPITCGIPWPKGMLNDPRFLKLTNAQNQNCLLQTRILDRWADGSIRWLLLDWQATVQGTSEYQLSITTEDNKSESPLSAVFDAAHATLKITTGTGQFTVKTQEKDNFLLFSPVNPSGQQNCSAKWVVRDGDGHCYFPAIEQITLEDEGILRVSARLTGTLKNDSGVVLAEFIARIHFFANSSTVCLQMTIRNSRKAEHPGGLWDLGNGGSIYLKDVALQMIGGSSDAQWSGVISQEPEKHNTFNQECELYQDSSGGENWKSTNHVNRFSKVPLRFRGYSLRVDENESTGLRATPTLYSQSVSQTLGIAVPVFWQNFPLALEAHPGELTLRLFPQQSDDLHELQGGEQKTHTIYLAFGPDSVSTVPLDWCRSPSHAVADPSWYATSDVVPFLTPRQSDPHQDYLQLVDAALDGSDTFASKREVIDEYGWRHFGDIYGDHEAVFHQGPTKLVSHYNNQYDAVAGLGYQYLRSADPRWLAEMQYLAQHVIDIDIYHTDQDKSAYNHGLFWHTFHYVDAHTGTHRSYPRDARVPPHGHPVPGGGPANEQNYTTGLMLHYFLTGQEASRQAAIGLAQWVIDMDDGSKTIFRWLSRSDTGLASKSRTASYHGPGRGAANSIAALLDGHRLTGERRFLEKAEQLIRRCIHPSDNVEQRNLLDAENRWFYTMFLQSLGRYLRYKQELGEFDSTYAYAQASLLHYVRWMADHEYPYLEKPEILEYPTETWAAQDMRKCEIFNVASLYADPDEATHFRQKADFFFHYSTSKLLSMPTRTLCRPVVLMLSFGFAHEWFKQHPEAKAPIIKSTTDFGQPSVFVPQKQIAIKRAKLIVAASGLAGILGLAALGYWLFGT